MPHGFGNERNVYARAVGKARPRVARNVRRQRTTAANEQREAVESVIVRSQPFEISVVDVGGCGVGKYRKNIFAALRCVPTDDFRHVRLNSHAHLMTSLMPGIVQHAVVYLLPFQIGNVYKRHSHSHETEHEYVACKCEVWLTVELQREQSAYL